MHNDYKKDSPRLLLHTCCAPCICYVSTVLNQQYSLTNYFYNPNIHPIEEYDRRLNELTNFSKQQNLTLIIENNDTDYWNKLVKGLENEPEGSIRCFKCYEMRLEKTALYAKENNYDLFTTVLSISPHKNAYKLNELGKQIERKYNIKYLEADFKKNDGFKKSCELSKKYNLYRQNYCGCLSSASRVGKSNQ